jgi:hypothetical protein
MKRYFRTTILAAATALAMAAPVFAGPPLLRHAYDIGTAKSLPWIGEKSWFEGRPDYNVKNVVADTEALLTPSTPVIVRMETLRRAAIYASTDPQVANALLKRFITRAEASEASGSPDALAYLDAAYLAGAFNEFTMLAQSAEWASRAAVARQVKGSLDAYALIAKSVALRPGDPAIQFAAALISSDEHRGAYAGHAAKARAGADADMLLARNLSHVQ